jgi:hypothetical protein
MKKETAKVLAKVLDDELLKFAIEFSDNFRIYHCGDYVSDDNNYHIHYEDELKGMTSQSWARSSEITTKKIELCRKCLVSDSKITSNYIFFMIIWCFLVKHTATFLEADRCTCEFYLTTHRDCSDIIYGWEQQFALNETKANKERLDIIRDILIRYKGVSDTDKIKQDILDLTMNKFGIHSDFGLTKKAIFIAMDNYADIIYQERIAEEEEKNNKERINSEETVWQRVLFHDNFCEMVRIINLFLIEEKQLKEFPTEEIDEIAKIFIIETRVINNIEIFAGSCQNFINTIPYEEAKNFPDLIKSRNVALKSITEKRELFSTNLNGLLSMLNLTWTEQIELLSTNMVEELFTRFEIIKR